MSTASQPRTLRVAIAGLGPKGLFALERLLSEATGIPVEVALEIDVFEPHASPGAGPVYDPSQPQYLRMNLAADGVDLWIHPNQTVPVDEQVSFVEWRRQTGVGSDLESYPPRSQVGRYLNDCFRRLLRAAPSAVRLRIHREAIDSITASDDGWSVQAAGRWIDCDEVLLCVGHQKADPMSLAAAWPHRARLIPSVFPVDSRLAAEQVAPRSSVAIRGFGLTFLDAALALTEGRGGRFESFEQSPWRLCYRPCGDEPLRIQPYARTGRTMLAKADPSIARSMTGMEAIGRAGGELVAALSTPASAAELLGIVTSTATACLLESGNKASPESIEPAARAWVTAPPGGDPNQLHPAEELRHSLRVSSGEEAPDLEWALAQSWLMLLPVIVARLGGDAFDSRQWLIFRELARKMERIAFGPPPINGAKLLALIEAGVVDLSHLSAGELTETESATELTADGGRPAVAVDHVVDAVMPAPGVLGDHGALYWQLIAAGHARVRPARRGVDVAPDGTCIGAEGRRTEGLATIGRPTEDSVIDNDTLNRTRHLHPQLWAKRVVARASDRAMSGASR